MINLGSIKRNREANPESGPFYFHHKSDLYPERPGYREDRGGPLRAFATSQGFYFGEMRVKLGTYRMGIDGPMHHFKKSKRQAWSWTKKREGQAKQVNDVIQDLKKYWPLTLRQVYYRLLGKMIDKNTKSKYQDLSRLLKFMRVDGLMPWVCIEDRTRILSKKRGFSDMEEFVEQELDLFLENYARCYVQGQEIYLEIWIEKDALSHIIQDIAWQYCVRLLTGRGYQSVSVQKLYVDRAREALERGQKPVILYNLGIMTPRG